MSQLPHEEFQEPANLVLLRRLVTVLLITMILGFVALIVLFVMRLSPERAAPLELPATLTLPDGTTPLAFTQGKDWYAVVTEQNEILIYNRADNALRQRVNIK